MSNSLINEFASLFAGNLRSYGRWDPATGNSLTEKAEVQISNYEDHVAGRMGLGIVPITDGGTVMFGAIDVDKHDDPEDVDLLGIQAKIEAHRLPLVMCRSKRGGAHLYLFGSEFLPAKLVIRLLSSWRDMLALPHKTEIFPKQDSVVTKSGEKSLGNWLNLCYFGGDDTTRYALDSSGRPMSFELFIRMAQSRRVTADQLREYGGREHLEAPPCIQKMIHMGVESGARNEAMYNVTVYLKRARPDTFFEDALELNKGIFDKPLGLQEARKVIRSASRRDYQYKCGEDPCKSLCDRKVCVTREFGISSEELKEMDSFDNMPKFTELIEYQSDPPRWGIHVNEKLISNIPTVILRDPQAMGTLIFEQLKINIPKISQEVWRKHVLDPLVPTLRTIEVPKEASASGVIVSKFKEFAQKADLSSDGTDIAERKAIMRNVPVVQSIDGVRTLVFKGIAFSEYLKRTKAELQSGMDLWNTLRRELGATHTKMRVPGATYPVNVWLVELTDEYRVAIDEPNFEPEY